MGPHFKNMASYSHKTASKVSSISRLTTKFCNSKFDESSQLLVSIDTPDVVCRDMALALMLLVANLTNTKRFKKPLKLLKPCQMGTHLIVLDEGFHMNTQMTWLG